MFEEVTTYDEARTKALAARKAAAVSQCARPQSKSGAARDG